MVAVLNVSRIIWIGLVLPVAPGAGSGERAMSGRTIHADLRLRTGGGLAGPVVDSTDHGLVVVHDHTPYVFAWEELEPASAYETKGALLALARGGKDRMTAEDLAIWPATASVARFDWTPDTDRASDPPRPNGHFTKMVP